MNAREGLDENVIGRLRRSVLSPVVRLAKLVWRHIPDFVKRSWVTRMTVETVRLVQKNRVTGIAAEVSFWGLLSVTPLLLVSASALGWVESLFGFGVAADAQSAMTGFVRDLLGINDRAVESIDELFAEPSASGLTFGLITSIYAASRGFTSLVGGIDHITGREEQRNFVTTRLAGVVAALASAPALVGLLVLVNVGRTGFGLPDPWSEIVAFSMWPLITAGLVGFAVTLLHSAPAQRTPWTADLLGALVAVVVWLGGSYIAARSLASFGNDVLGILGGSVGLLFWLYVMTLGILIGAQVNVARHNVSGNHQTPEPDPVDLTDLV